MRSRRRAESPARASAGVRLGSGKTPRLPAIGDLHPGHGAVGPPRAEPAEAASAVPHPCTQPSRVPAETLDDVDERASGSADEVSVASRCVELLQAELDCIGWVGVSADFGPGGVSQGAGGQDGEQVAEAGDGPADPADVGAGVDLAHQAFDDAGGQFGAAEVGQCPADGGVQAGERVRAGPRPGRCGRWSRRSGSSR
jgi:hypothetical protein